MFSFKCAIIFALYAIVFSTNAHVKNTDNFEEELETRAQIRKGQHEEAGMFKLFNYESFEKLYPEEHYRVRRQINGTNEKKSHNFAFNSGPAWTSFSQTSNNLGSSVSSTGYSSPAGYGISKSIFSQQGTGAQGHIPGQINLLNTPNHQVTAWGKHTKNFDGFKSTSTNTVGVTYLSKDNGASAFLSGTYAPGSSNKASVGGNYPIFHRGNTRLDGTAQSTFGEGMKPNHQLGLKLNYTF